MGWRGSELRADDAIAIDGRGGAGRGGAAGVRAHSKQLSVSEPLTSAVWSVSVAAHCPLPFHILVVLSAEEVTSTWWGFSGGGIKTYKGKIVRA